MLTLGDIKKLVENSKNLPDETPIIAFDGEEPSHLIKGTNADNMRDMVERGRSSRRGGADNPSAKLTTDQIKEIRIRLASKESAIQISKDYGVHFSTIYRIANNECWKE